MNNRRIAATLALCAMLVSLLPTSTALAGHLTATWIGPTGNWNDATKWNTTDYPHNNGDTYDVLIGTATVTVASRPTITNLTLADPSLAGVTINLSDVLTVVNKFTWSGGSLEGFSQLRSKDVDLSGQLALKHSSFLSYGGVARLTDDNGQIDNQSNVAFRNDSAAQFIFMGDGDYSGEAGFDNFGQLIKQAGGSGGVTEISGPLRQAGALDVQSGTLRLKPIELTVDTASEHEGTTQIGSGAVLELQGGTHVFDTAAPVAGAGILRVTDGGTLRIDGISTTVDTQLELINGGISGNGQFDANGKITWSGGTLSGSGIANFNLSGHETMLTGDLQLWGTRILNLDNNTTFAGNGNRLELSTGAQLNNELSRRLTIAGDSDLLGGGTFRNRGRLLKQNGGDDGITRFRGNFHNEVTGVVDVQSGARLELATSGSHHGRFEGQGTLDFAYSIGATQRLEIDSQVEVKHVEFHSVVDIDGLYDNVLTTTIELGEARFNAVSFTDSLMLTGGTLGGTGSLTALGATNWNGGTMGGAGTFTPQGGMQLAGDLTLAEMRTINNTAATTYVGNGALSSSAAAEFVNQATGSLSFSGDADFLGGTIKNHGQLLKTGGTGLTEITATVDNLSTGLIQVQSGTLKLKDGAHSGRFEAFTGATMEFTGTSSHDASDIVIVNSGSLIRGADPAAGAVRFTDGETLLDNGTQISGPGFARVAGGTVNVGDEATDTVTAENLAVDAGLLGGSGTLEVNGHFEMTAGTMGGDGVTNLKVTAELSSDPVLAGTRTVNNEGELTYSGDGGRLTQEFGSSPVFNNRGSFTFSGDSDLVTSAFHNEGTLVKQAGGDDGLSIMSVVNNSGSVQVESGTLSIGAAGSHTGDFSGGGTLELSGVHQLQPGSSVTVSRARIGGTIDIDGSYNVPQTEALAGEAKFNATASTQSLEIGGGTISGSGTLNVSGTTHWTSGGMGGSGVTNLNGPVNIEGFVSLNDSRVLNNFATATYAGDYGRFWNSYATSTFHNRASAQLIFAGDSDYYNGTIQNDGTLVKQAGASDGRTVIAATLNNAGTVSVPSGTLALDKGGSHSGQFIGSGTLEFSGGTATLQASAQVAVDHMLLSGGTTYFGGAYNVSETTITGYDHHFNSTALTNLLYLAGGTVHGNGTLTVSGLTDWTSGWMRGGGVTNAEGGLLVSSWAFLEDTRTLNSAGLTEVQGDFGGFWNGSRTTFNNLPAAELRFDGDSDYLFGTLNNQGLVVKQAGAGDGVTEVSAAVNNGGEIEVQSGRLHLTGTYTQTAGSLSVAAGAALMSTNQLNVQGGTLAAADGVTIDADVSLGGVMQVGGSTGVVTLDGDYSQAFSGTLAVEIGGRVPGEYDQLNITGSAILRGTLDVSLVGSGGDPFVPLAGDAFEILTAGSSMIGLFGNPPILPPLTGGLSWNINYDIPNTRVLLEVLTSSLAADFDGDGDVDGDDLTDPVDGWEARFGTDLVGADFLAWQRQFGSSVPPLSGSRVVPEPRTVGLLVGLVVIGIVARRNSGVV